MSNKQPQCARCGHLAVGPASDSFLQTPCKHLFCDKCVHRLFSLQSRVSCVSCGRHLYRHELTATASSQDDLFDQVVANIRRNVCSIMNKDRTDCSSTPDYDRFLEEREDLILRFIQFQQQSAQSLDVQAVNREELNKLLKKYENENQAQILRTRSTADERRRRNIAEIIDSEGTFYERINVDYEARDSVIDHPLAIEFAELLRGSAGASGGAALSSDHLFQAHATADLMNRRARLIPSPAPTTAPSVPQIVLASGCEGIWRTKATAQLISAFRSYYAPITP